MMVAETELPEVSKIPAKDFSTYYLTVCSKAVSLLSAFSFVRDVLRNGDKS